MAEVFNKGKQKLGFWSEKLKKADRSKLPSWLAPVAKSGLIALAPGNNVDVPENVLSEIRKEASFKGYEKEGILVVKASKVAAKEQKAVEKKINQAVQVEKKEQVQKAVPVKKQRKPKKRNK